MSIGNYGWVPDLPDHRDVTYSAPAQLLMALPTSVDLTSKCPPVYDQGQLGSCTGNAIAGAIQFEQIKQNLNRFTPSRLFIYYNQRVLGNTVNSDSGAQIRDGMKVVAKLGAPPETDWPYDITKFADKPPASAFTDAAKNKVVSYQRVSRSLNHFKGCLASGYPFVFGFTVYDNFESSNVAQTGHAAMPQPNEQVAGGHAVMAVGYDDQGQRFLVRNSWGTSWGMNGYFTLPYQYLLEPNLSGDFWIVRIESKQTGPPPQQRGKGVDIVSGNRRSTAGPKHSPPKKRKSAMPTSLHGVETASRATVFATGLQAATASDNLPRLFRVWYGTDRSLVNVREPGLGFTNDRDPNNAVHFGSCTVYVPKTHKFGSTGTSWLKRWIRLQFEDDHLKIVAREDSANAEQFFSEIRQEIATLSSPDRQILVYLHGYCVSFDEAALRAAQIGFDLKIAGITAFFSWPSCGSVEGYTADEDRVAASESAIAAFLQRLRHDTGARAVHVIAHSMGNRGFARSIQRIVSDASKRGVRFGQIILAAPDMEVSLFRELAAVYPKISSRTTMYVCARDRALWMSRFLHNSDRAGFTPPITIVPYIDTVEVTAIDLTMLGHSYIAEAEPVLYDMMELLTHNSPPDRRARIVRAGSAGQRRYWVFKE